MTPNDIRPIKLEPHFTPREWGGHRLRTLLGKAAPEGERIGESWELSDHPDGLSRVASGTHEGELFGELLRRHPGELLGLARAPVRFPLLVKYIDAAEHLSLQVHPDDDYARQFGDRGKSESWYVMESEPGAEVIHGLRHGMTDADLADAAASGDWDRHVRRHAIQPGSFIAVPPGTVHAILGGTLLCEVQQASNLTYRLYDWGRASARTLHIEDAMRVTRLDRIPPAAIETRDHPGGLMLFRNEFFEVALHVWRAELGGSEWRFENLHGLIVSIVEGSGEWRTAPGAGDALRRGETWFLPAGLERLDVTPTAPTLRLLTTESLELDSPELLR